MKKKLCITILFLVVFLSMANTTNKKIPEGFWSAPIAFSSYLINYQNITPDIIFRKVKFKNIQNGTEKTVANLEKYSFEDGLIIMVVDIKVNNKPIIRMIAKFLYNKEQELNYIKSVFIKYSSGEHMNFSVNDSIDNDGLNEMNSKKIGEVNGAFWGMMIDQVLDLEDLSKLMPKSENETVDSDSSTNESENETVEPDSSTNESENDDTDVQIDE